MIFAFQGNQRAGKTLSMVAFACALQDCFPKQKIYANIWFNREHYQRFEKWRELEDVYNSLIVFDEIGTAMDSRNYASSDQIYFTHLFAQMGKRGNTFLYTAQRDHTVEKRTRDNTDFVIECQKSYPHKEIIQDWYDAQRSREKPNYIGRKTIDKPELFYGLYNTFETVKSKVKIYEKKSR